MPIDLNEVQNFLHSTPAERQWKKIGVRRHTGVNIPLFSLHSQKSTGVGEFPDFLPIINWCSEIGLDIIQTLPLNDTGIDVSPYSALSAFALNPLHLGLTSLPELEKNTDLIDALNTIKQHNTGQRVNFQVLYKEREDFLQKYYLAVFKNFQGTQEYQNFIQNNPWLHAYALFKTLKIKHLWCPWADWPEEQRIPDPQQFASLLKEYESFVSYHIFIQYLCFNQMEEVKRFANSKNVLLKGDLPILINRESAEAWNHPSFFIMNLAAGAPPDMYSEEGQKWGFPLYNWPEMEKQNYSWWRQRLAVANRLYDIYRLDHIVGFFRIWAIPLEKTAKEGEFFPADEALWVPQGEKIMRMMLESTEMLPIGEDLGVVPPPVRVVLRNLGICGTKVLRWERNWNTDQQFINPKDFDPISMSTVSTHDSETLTLWWKDAPMEAQVFCISKQWTYNANLSKEHLFELLRESHQSGSLFHINLLHEYFPLVDGMSWEKPEDERINFPGLILERNWTYRFRPSVEEIVASEDLARIFKQLMN